MTQPIQTQKSSKRSMARSFLTTLAVMIALSGLVLAIGMDGDAQAGTNAPLTGLETLQQMTAPSAN